MKVILLNSGIGKRMGSLTTSRPKCLVPLSSTQTILDFQLRSLVDNNLTEFIVTTGPFADILIDYIDTHYPSLNIRFIHNPQFNSTNYLYSLHLIPNHLIDDDLLLFHGDLIFNSQLLISFINSSIINGVLINKEISLPEKDFKGRIINEKVTEIGVDIFDSNCWTLMPLYKLTKDFFLTWKHQMAEFVRRGETGVYAEKAFNVISHQLLLRPFYFSNQLCMEIDTPDDLSLAQSLIPKSD